MSKFKAGDKVRVKSAGLQSYWYSDQIGEQYTLLKKDGRNWAIKEYECGVLVEEDIELVVPSFDLHKNPWYIRVENEEQFNLANEWLRENFGSNLMVSYWNNVVGITNTDAAGNIWDHPMWLAERHIQENIFRHELKLNFKTTISSVEYPVVEIETEQQKRIRELKETIDSASKQLEELMKETK